MGTGYTSFLFYEDPCEDYPPSGSKFFPYKIDPILQGYKMILTELPLLKVYPFSLTVEHILDDDLVFYVPFNII